MDKEILDILKTFEKNGFEVAVVGGAARDLLLDNKPSDWDLTTNAIPEEILKIFPGAFYNNRFGTVGIKSKQGIVEATTYRSERSYTDSRHPDKVTWSKTLVEDLARRDFTINAIAFVFENGKLKQKPIDLYKGQEDLNNKLIRTVGKPDQRFTEDALRLLRAVRFASTLGFDIDENTKKSMKKNAKLIKNISGERIRDELFKMIDSNKGMEGMEIARETGLLYEFLPELEICFSVEQKSLKRHHIFDVGTHCVMSLKHCPSKNVIVRFATMLHDIGKAQVANITEEGVRTFYNHEVAGGRQVLDISKRLHLSRIDQEKLYKLVRWHQFSVNEDQTDKAIRRFIRNVGLENVEDMMDLRIGDRLGGGLQQPQSWRLKLFRRRIKDVLKKPFSITDLKINGKDVMITLKIKAGPKVGKILNKLFEEVQEDNTKNKKEYLIKRTQEIKV